MTKKKITFDVTDKGMTIETEGYSGKTCLTELENIRVFMKKEYGVILNINDIKMTNTDYAKTQTQKEVRRA